MVLLADGETVSELVAEAVPLTLAEPVPLMDSVALALSLALGYAEPVADTDGAADCVGVRLDEAVPDC